VRGTISINPPRTWDEKSGNDALNCVDFLTRRALVAFVANGKHPEASTVEQRRSNDRLPFKASASCQSFLIEQLRCEGTDARRQPPSLRQEDPTIFRNRLASIQDVIECGDIGPVRMAPLLWLLKLLRIPDTRFACCR
jgi:hypothetical protein